MHSNGSKKSFNNLNLICIVNILVTLCSINDIPKKYISNLCSRESIRTPKQICDGLIAEGYKIHYNRLPVVIAPNAHSPKDYFDEFVTAVNNSGRMRSRDETG